MKRIGFACRLLRAAIMLFSVGATLVSLTEAGSPKKQVTLVDTIEVVGHLALPETSVVALTTSAHWRREFLQLQDPDRGVLTVVDVTDPTHPSIVRRLRLPEQLVQSSLAVLSGDAAMLTGTKLPSAAPQPDSVSIVSFADPDHPTTVRKFDNVSAFRIHRERGLIYLANPDGLWILQQNPAPDQELESEYARQILYDH